MEARRPLDTEALLAQAGWMRALAFSLLGDPGASDDVVQDATLAALLHSPASDEHWRPWLSRVVRNFAARRLRNESRRSELESSSSPPKPERSPDEALGSLELQRLLLDAVSELEEPLRATIALRYFEGRSSAEIARSQGVPAGTVRWRLKRGLEVLRERLDARLGSREQWALLFAPFAKSAATILPGAGAAAVVSNLLTGALAMKASLYVVGGALLALVVWLCLPQADRSVAATPTPEVALAPATSMSEAQPAAHGVESSRQSIAQVAQDEGSAKTSATDAGGVNELRGRVLGAADQPLQGARVSLHCGELREFMVLDLELGRATQQIAEVTSDARGAFRFQVDRGLPVDVHVDAEGYCPASITDRHAGEFVEVRMTAGFRVFGRVTRASDGAPVFDAQVRVFRLGGPSSLARETRTAGNGTYEVRIPFDEGATLEIVPQAELGPGWIKLAFDANGETEQNFAVEEGFTLVGKVTEAGTGKPIANATIGEGWTYRRKTQTDANGEYQLKGFGDPGIRQLFAKARGFGQASVSDLPAAVDKVVHVDFKLTPARSAHGRVVDRSGAPLTGVLAAAIASEGWDDDQRTDWLSCRTDASGSFAIENLTPELKHALMLSLHGFATSVYDFPRAELTTADIDLGTFTLGPPALIAGVVQDESGAGVAEAEVTLTGGNSSRGGATGIPPIAEHYTNGRRTTTDAQGRFWFGDLPAGSFTLQAERRGQPPGETVRTTLAEGEHKERVTLALTSGLHLSVRVVDPEGHPVVGASVYAVSPKTFAESRASGRTDGKGKLELAGLPAGDYSVNANPWGNERPDAPLLGTRVEHVSPGAKQELEIVLPRGECIRGILVDAHGVAVPGCTVAIRGGSSSNRSATTEADGSFWLPVPAGSVVDLEVPRPRERSRSTQIVAISPDAPASYEPLLIERAVRAGTHDLKLTLP